MYYYGQGVPEDRTEADRWYRKAADQDYEQAQRVL
jgi:TPR repeat protein